MKFSLDAQIEEVATEINKRIDVYGRLVAANKMRQSVGDYQIARMKAVLATLRWIKDHENEIRADVRAARDNPVEAGQEKTDAGGNDGELSKA